VVSTPCAAPFLAPALGAALALPAVPSLALFTMIALGLALPYLFLSAFPQFVKRLPRPGPWMETLKQFMAFPLYATVAFIVYVLAGQVEDEVFLITLGGLVLIALGLWGYGRWTQHGGQAKRRVFGYGFATACVALGLGFGYPGSGKTEWQDWRPGLPEELSRDGKIVYVDFTARWCATCKVNKLRVLNTTHIQEEFARRGVVRLKADWTNEDPEITRALESFGRSAVPLNVVYAPGLADPILLPEILTDDNVLAALDAAQAAKTAKR
jgi:thiol:disulfide interchange protein DsbD